MWNKTITLYNRYEDPNTGAISWHRHLITGCFIKHTNQKSHSGNVTFATDETIIRIPEQPSYMPPHQWIDLPADKKSKNMTLRGGDLIFLGTVNKNIDEYTAGQRSSDLIAKYSALGAVFVSSVNVNTDLPGAHYYVRGK